MKQTYTLVGFISQVTSRSVSLAAVYQEGGLYAARVVAQLAIHAEHFLRGMDDTADQQWRCSLRPRGWSSSMTLCCSGSARATAS